MSPVWGEAGVLMVLLALAVDSITIKNNSRIRDGNLSTLKVEKIRIKEWTDVSIDLENVHLHRKTA